MPAEGRSLDSRAVCKGVKDMTTDENLTGSDKVRRLQHILHAKAKENPKLRFHALSDKVWREDFMIEAYRQVRRNGGTAGVDGETFSDIEVIRSGELARGTGAGTEGRELRTASGTTGSDSEETTWQVAGFRHSLSSRPGGAEFGDAGVIADL